DVIGQLDETVDHGVLGRCHGGIAAAGQEDRGAFEERDDGLQFVDELLHFERRLRERLGADEAVEHEDRRLATLHLLAKEREQALQTLFLEGRVAAHVVHALGETRFVEEVQALHVHEEPRVGFGEQRHVDDAAPAGGMRERDLVRQDRLASARRSDENVDPAVEKSSSEQRVEAFDPRRNPLCAHALLFGSHPQYLSQPTFAAKHGIATTNDAPPRGASSTSIVPPWASTIWRAIHSPRPSPLVPVGPLPRSNLLKMRLRRCEGMPGPLSMTTTRASSCARSSATVQGAPAAFFAAFLRRFPTTSSSRTGSPSTKSVDGARTWTTQPAHSSSSCSRPTLEVARSTRSRRLRRSGMCPLSSIVTSTRRSVRRTRC